MSVMIETIPGRKITTTTDIKTMVIPKKIIKFLENNPYDYFTREELQRHCKTTPYVLRVSLRILLSEGKIEVVRKISKNKVYQLKGFRERRQKLIESYNNNNNQNIN